MFRSLARSLLSSPDARSNSGARASFLLSGPNESVAALGDRKDSLRSAEEARAALGAALLLQLEEHLEGKSRRWGGARERKRRIPGSYADGAQGTGALKKRSADAPAGTEHARSLQPLPPSDNYSGCSSPSCVTPGLRCNQGTLKST